MKILLDEKEQKQYPHCPKEIPMELLNEKMAQRNHGQSLGKLNHRGGMGPQEICANMRGIHWGQYTAGIEQAIAEIIDAIDHHQKEINNSSPSLNEMDIVISDWFYKDEPQHWTKISWHKSRGSLLGAMDKMCGGSTVSGGVMYPEKLQTYWFSIFPLVKTMPIDEKDQYITKVVSYSCAFTENGIGRMGGPRLPPEFEQPTIELAMHYSLYRLIKFGLEY